MLQTPQLILHWLLSHLKYHSYQLCNHEIIYFYYLYLASRSQGLTYIYLGRRRMSYSLPPNVRRAASASGRRYYKARRPYHNGRSGGRYRGRNNQEQREERLEPKEVNNLVFPRGEASKLLNLPIRKKLHANSSTHIGEHEAWAPSLLSYPPPNLQAVDFSYTDRP